jgi:ClpX C4-type zinc finger
LLFHCDACSAHGSAREAKNRAETIYRGLSAHCAEAHVSVEEAEQYLDELFGEERCSLCGRRADQVEKIIQRTGARVCDRCSDDLAQQGGV